MHMLLQNIYTVWVPFYISQQKRGGGNQALNSLAIKQAMPARNAGTGDCSAAHPSISARLRGCVSTMHVLPWAPTYSPATRAGSVHMGSRSQVPACSPAPKPTARASQGSLLLPLAGQLEVYRPPQVLPLELPRRTSGNQGLLPSSCSLYCLELRLVPALLHPPRALDAVQTSGTSSPKGSQRWPVEWAVRTQKSHQFQGASGPKVGFQISIAKGQRKLGI